MGQMAQWDKWLNGRNGSMDESDDPPHHELRPAPKKKEEEEGRMEEKKEGNVLFFTYGYMSSDK